MKHHLCEIGRVVILSVVVNQGAVPAGESPTAGKAEGLNNPFFAYSVRASDEMLRELGYTPMRNLYTGIKLDQEPLYKPEVVEQIKRLRGTNAIVWLTILGNRTKVTENEPKAVAAVRELADVAAEVGLKVSIYPHSGFYAATAREAVRIVKQVDRKNVGVTLNLCHELMAGNADEMPQIIDEVASYLSVVTINGADHKKKEQKMGWDRLIQPLGQGNFDVYGHLKKLKAVGYDGPVGLQCYGLKTDPAVHLKQSIEAWKAYSARLAAETRSK